MLAVIISGIITTGLLGILLGGLVAALRARGPAIRAALAIDGDRIEARPAGVTATAYWPEPRALAA